MMNDSRRRLSHRWLLVPNLQIETQRNVQSSCSLTSEKPFDLIGTEYYAKELQLMKSKDLIDRVLVSY